MTTVKNFIKINKQVARRIYDEGGKIFIHPCKMRVDNLWQEPLEISNSEYGDFDTLVTRFELSNCNNQLGRYAAFYKITDVVI